MKEQILNNIDKIIKELEKGNDITIKKTKEGVKILSAKVKRISA